MKKNKTAEEIYNENYYTIHERGKDFVIKIMEEYASQFRQPDVSGRSEQLVAFLKWVGDGYDFENNAEKIVKDYIDEGN
jgi:hypothetical protein